VPECERALDVLVQWGNLRRSHDTGRVATLADFRRRHLIYQLTPAGEAAERAVGEVVAALERSGSLHLEQFLGELSETAPRITAEVQGIDLDAERLILLAAQADAAPSPLGIPQLSRTLADHALEVFNSTLSDPGRGWRPLRAQARRPGFQPGACSRCLVAAPLQGRWHGGGRKAARAVELAVTGGSAAPPSPSPLKGRGSWAPLGPG
jgi:hypothetical protein